MKNIHYLVIIFILLTAFTCEKEHLDFEKYGSVSGIILDGETYTPLEGVLVVSNPASTSTITNSEGAFVISKITNGDIAITARKKDFLTNSVSVAVYEDENTAINFFMLKDEREVGSVYIYEPVPGNGAVDQRSSFTFTWNVDQENKSKELDYTVYLFESNSTVQTIVGESLITNEVTVSDLEANTTYYWYVVAKFEGHNVANSPTWSFKTATDFE
ncbi:carboxypeptidase-like regulatory domain-containing protein [Carboxylicivirga marina]|uniref:Carboxypeptidase-like regulatory domain-containing protein n=1 Tax=Carboxylicivirga marina TaxID=2800988 RepID=A0ABS1HH50_9BACT|nr:carboxypeptidase-like regulatory domain-containing protein [Carboxylicivirga marina]MBK3516950.1 carboxypeptidase-like regulatory domain-containing protein [Carboxylicivirga marina]